MSEGMPTHELDLVVGSMISVSPDDDRAMYEEEKSWIEDVQDVLREDGIDIDLTVAPGTEPWTGGIDRFVDLDNLRRFAVHLERGEALSGLNLDEDEEEVDPLLADIWEGVTQTRFTHLINHQLEGGYYLPVDFPEVIWLTYEDEEAESDWDQEEVVSFGSSVALLRELNELEPLLLQSDGHSDMEPALKAMRTLREAAEQSVQHRLPLILW